MEKRRKTIVVHTQITPAQREEMGKILDRLTGTPIERTGDIAVDVGNKRYVFSDQTGARVGASVARDGGTEVVRPKPPYRQSLVKQTAADGLAKVADKGQGEEFTLKALSTGWHDLSDSEQRNAGKQFRKMIDDRFAGQFDSWTTSDNERHYRRR